MKTRTKANKKHFFTSNIVYVLLLGLIFRLLLSFFGTLQLDQGTFVAWSNNLVSNGFRNFYNGWSDYLPGYLYVLWILGKINVLNIIPTTVLYKLPAIIADILTGYLIYRILKKNKHESLGIIGAFVYIFNPAIFINSSLWGQVDSLTALAALLSIYLLDRHFILSAIVLSIGTLIKPQAAFIMPLILFLFFKNKKSMRDLIVYCVIGLLFFVLCFIPFSNGNLFRFILDRLSLSAGQYPFTSVNAFNFWGILGAWKPDTLFTQIGGYVFVGIAITVLFIRSFKKKVSPYALASFIFASSFMFFTRMHERHLLPVFAPLTIVALENPIMLIPYLGFSIVYVLNLAFSYQWITHDFLNIYPDIFVKFFGLIGVVLAIFVFIEIYKNKKITWKQVKKRASILTKKIKKYRIGNSFTKIKLSKVNLTKKASRIILIGILLFAFATRVYKLNSPAEMYFDEVYHAFTAKVMMSGENYKAWEWWNTPPEGFAYEWTHPPIAKLGMVLGMSIFGQSPFGWRIPGAILGVGSVFLVYLIAKKVFNDELTALLSAAVFSIDGLPLVASRIGMNDSYFLFFTLFAIYLFMQKKDFLSALAYGLALSSKWSALWAAPIIFLLWLKRKDKFKPSVMWFMMLPPVIYLLSYFPMFSTGHNLETWWGMQKQMWWYHTGLVATHSYSSPWWTWPFLIRPVYLYTSSEVSGLVSRIYMMGNPFVFWFGIVSVLTSVVYAYFEKNKEAAFVVFSYLIFFVPWAASPRIMFFYHYLPSIPFLAIATGYVLRRNHKLIMGYLLICLLVFIYFYPHWSGLQIPVWLDKSYYWLTSWR